MLRNTPDGIYCDYCLKSAGGDPEKFPQTEGADCGIDVGYGGSVGCDCESCSEMEISANEYQHREAEHSAF